MDPDFRKLFKMKVEFADDAPMNKDNANKLARSLKDIVTTNICHLLIIQQWLKIVE